MNMSDRKESQWIFMIHICNQHAGRIKRISYDPETKSVTFILRGVNNYQRLCVFQDIIENVDSYMKVEVPNSGTIKVFPVYEDPRVYLRGYQIPLEAVIDLR